MPPWQIATYAYINVAPNPVGVGQTVTVYIWLYNTFDSELLTNDYRFHNYILTITKPDGTTSTQTWAYISDSTSSQITAFTPDQVGVYKFNFTFPGQDINTYSHNPNSLYVNDTYLPSSASTTLTVQQEQLPAPIGSYPLPSQYWTRPIYGENPDWWSISSNWLGTGSPQMSNGNFGKFAYVPDAVGPRTAHIMWTKLLQSGGIVGGNEWSVPGVGWFEGSAYNTRYSNPKIIDGKLYYTEPVSFTGSSSGPTDCVDLRTGQVIWSRIDVPAPSFGYIYNLWDPNQHGVFPPILFTANFARAFDADTGNQLFNVTNVPTGKAALGPQGEHLRYVMTNLGTSGSPNWVLAQWNSSKLWCRLSNPYTGGFLGSPSIINTTGILITTIPVPFSGTTGTLPNGTSITVPYGSTLLADGGVLNSSSPQNRYDWNVSIPWANTLNMSTFIVFAAYCNDMMLCWNCSNLFTLPGSSAKGAQSVPYTYFAVNLNASRGAIGSILWMNTLQPPPGNLTVVSNAVDPVNRIFTEEYRETVQWVAYSMDTGQKLWGPTASQTAVAALDYYGNQFSGHMLGEAAYGKLYSIGFAGILFCYDLKNGTLLWTYGNGGPGNSTNGGLAIFYGNYPTFVTAIGNGVIYLETTEHTITDPIYKGALTRAINATTGKEIWTLSAYTGGGSSMSQYAIADGYATYFNGYDNQIYVIGRGPSATTVEAPLTAITAGNNVVIQGTVMDTSAGTKQTQQVADFPQGVPCASDASMTDWMEYVYQQRPLPANFTGVPVSIDAVDPNGNCIHIGDATTDANGIFHYVWTTPNIPGGYTVTATFAGTNGYWPSYAQTAMYVSEAPPSPTPTPAAAPLPPYELYTIGTGIAIIVAVAIATILILRKRP
jgi:outer membrane protein assembly factor BamB